MRRSAVVIGLVALSTAARADEIPTVTITDVGPNQEIPTGRSFYLEGGADSEIQVAQAIVVRKGSPAILGDSGADCGTIVHDLRIEAATRSAADDPDDEDQLDEPLYAAGAHRAFEVFPYADRAVRGSSVLVSAAWQRSDDGARRYKLLVPHDAEFFSAGYGFCTFVVTTERKQEIDDATLTSLIDGLARKLIACADRSSCQDEALDDYEAKAQRVLAGSRSIAAGPLGEAKHLAAQFRQAAKSELGSATGLIDARDRLQDKWAASANVMQPAAQGLWLDTSSDPLAHATTTLLARSASLLPQVHTGGKGTSVTLFTTDGRLAVGALQILDDGRSLRVASGKTPSGEQARVVTATTDTLAIADDLTLYDLIQLGRGKVRVDGRSAGSARGSTDHDWISLEALGQRVTALGLDEWTTEDTAFLGAALGQLRRLQTYVELATTGASCKLGKIGAGDAELTPAAITHQLGDWLACQRADGAALASLVQQLSDLVAEDQSWKAAKDGLLAKARRIVIVTTTAPTAVRVGFETKTWLFSYVTPVIGYAAIVRTSESFGLFYAGIQLHFDPNPVEDVLWAHGLSIKDLRRSIALELAVAPTGGSFGPDNRFSGLAGFPPIFVGAAVHLLPYTSITIGGTLMDRKRSTLASEDPHASFAPYIGFTLQLNLPDLVRQTVRTTSNTTVLQ